MKDVLTFDDVPLAKKKDGEDKQEFAVLSFDDVPKAVKSNRQEAIARAIIQGLTFDLADDAYSGIKSLFTDKTWKEEYDQEQKNIQAAKDNLGETGYLATNIAGGMLLPGVGIAKGAQALSKLGRLGRAVVATTGGATTGAVSTYGAQDEKDAGGVLTGGLMGAGLGILGEPVAKGAWHLGKAGLKLGQRAASFGVVQRALARNPGKEFQPSEKFLRRAADDLAKKLGKEGINTSDDILRRADDAAVEGSESVFLASAPSSIRNEVGDSLARINAGLPDKNNKVTQAIERLRMSGNQAHGPALADRIRQRTGVNERGAEAINRMKTGIESANERIRTEFAAAAPMRVDPRLVKEIDEAPLATNAYMKAIRDQAGPERLRDLDRVPLPRAEYNRQMELFEAGERATRPVRLTADNMPSQVYSFMRTEASNAAKNNDQGLASFYRSMKQYAPPANTKGDAIETAFRVSEAGHSALDAYKRGLGSFQGDSKTRSELLGDMLGNRFEGPARREVRSGSAQSLANLMSQGIQPTGASRKVADAVSRDTTSQDLIRGLGLNPDDLRNEVLRIDNNEFIASMLDRAMNARTGAEYNHAMKALDEARASVQFGPLYGTAMATKRFANSTPDVVDHARVALSLMDPATVAQRLEAARARIAARASRADQVGMQVGVIAPTLGVSQGLAQNYQSE
jgi:hypothetical protein